MCISPSASSSDIPVPNFSPNVRFRERGLALVTYKSPNPAGPNPVSGLAPIIGSSRCPSANPTVMSAALRLSPPMLSRNPSTTPQERATVFLNAPHNSQPTESSLGTSTIESVERRSAILVATEISCPATIAVVITPRATSGAMVGPVRTTTELERPAFAIFDSIASEIRPEPPSSGGASPLARSRTT